VKTEEESRHFAAYLWRECEGHCVTSIIFWKRISLTYVRHGGRLPQNEAERKGSGLRI
jgi:hypothetical protein